MNVKKILVAFALASFAGAGLLARADEQKIKESECPKAVVDSVKKKYPKAELKGFAKETTKKGDKEVTSYEVNVELGKRKIDVDLSAEGKILAEEEVIEKDALPDKVKKGLADSKYAKWEIKKIEKLVKEEKEDSAQFEVVVTNGEQKFELVFDGNGKITKEEEKKVKKAKAGEKKDEDEDD